MRTAGCRRQRPFKTFGFLFAFGGLLLFLRLSFRGSRCSLLTSQFFFSLQIRRPIPRCRRPAPDTHRAPFSLFFSVQYLFTVSFCCVWNLPNRFFVSSLARAFRASSSRPLNPRAIEKKKTTATTTTTAAATTAAATTATSFTSNTIGPPRCNGPADPPTIFDRLPRSFFDNRPGFIQFHSPSLPSFTLS